MSVRVTVMIIQNKDGADNTAGHHKHDAVEICTCRNIKQLKRQMMDTCSFKQRINHLINKPRLSQSSPIPISPLSHKIELTMESLLTKRNTLLNDNKNEIPFIKSKSNSFNNKTL